MKRLCKKMLVCVAGSILILSMTLNALSAEQEPDNMKLSNITEVEGNIPQPKKGEFQRKVAQMRGNFTDGASRDKNTFASGYAVESEESLYLDMNARGTWLLADEIFQGTGEVTASNQMDMYIVQTSSPKAAAMKIVSDNPNLVVRLYMLDVNTGVATGTNIYDSAADDGAYVLGTMPADNYVLGISSLDSNSPAGGYTLLWNCANPGGATALASVNSDLSNVILGYAGSTPRIYCNGIEWLAELKWEEHYTLGVGSGYSGRDQKVSNVKVKRVNVGAFNSNKYTTNNALFVEVGAGTLWSIMRSQLVNEQGQVTHVMDWYDATGQKTPRYLDGADEQLGPHYIVIDMNTNEVVDFASPYNYLWLTGSTTGTATFTSTNILGQ